MLKLSLDFKRIKERKKLTGLLPGKLVVIRTGRLVSARAVDITEDGMGIFSSHRLHEGDKMTLISTEKKIPLIVHYKKRDYTKASLHRYGLRVDSEEADAQEYNLIKIFENSGCLRT